MLHPKMKSIYVGADIHKRTHTAVIINCFCEKLGEVKFENNLEGFGKLMEEVKKHLKRGITPIFGLEDTQSNGRSLTSFLLRKNHRVKSVDSSLTYSERRNQSIIHKTDSHDAFCVAKALLNKLNELPDAAVDDRYWTLKLLVARRNAIIKTRAALKNQVHSHIMHHYPAYRKFFNSIYCKSAMEFWREYPSPKRLQGITKEELGEFLHKHSSGFFDEEKASEILHHVAKSGDTLTDLQESRDFIITQCIDEIKHCDSEAEKIEREIAAIMERFPYKLHTMPGVELVTSAMLVSEIGDIGRFKDSGRLAKYAGIAPITYSSGDKDRTFRNRQGNRDLYNIFHDLAARSINTGRNKKAPVNEIFKRYYEKKLKDGKTEHQAIICVMRNLVNIVYGMMKHQREYVKPILPKLETK